MGGSWEYVGPLGGLWGLRGHGQGNASAEEGGGGGRRRGRKRRRRRGRKRRSRKAPRRAKPVGHQDRRPRCAHSASDHQGSSAKRWRRATWVRNGAKRSWNTARNTKISKQH
eukprot:2898682-Pyramimonas_sp.AAC.1